MYSITKVIIAVGALVAPTVAFNGDMTYYAPGLGSCGSTNTESDAVVALSTSKTGNCGKTININYGGATVRATVVDTCAGCAAEDIDVSPIVFEQLSSLDAGRVQVEWDFA
ncbi:hypothetical protein M426DRAFT_65668 [Hypoxylon sp. CI-4A]|nr:hypothetical protein M426DRAFT_65668 [Hypoxylon sp. CI-4A]